VSYHLHFAPGACSRVTLTALEQVGVAYTVQAVQLAQGEQLQPAYLALNPKGKVPRLQTPDGPLTETLAIALYLDERHPQAGLLPRTDAYRRAQALAWLAWCATTLHPLVYRMRMTARIHPDAATHDTVRAAARDELARQWPVAEQALQRQPWLGGAQWHLGDTYLLWACERARQSGMDLAAWPALAAWAARCAAWPAWQRALVREAAGA
jgi:glutathione S-transferase